MDAPRRLGLHGRRRRAGGRVRGGRTAAQRIPLLDVRLFGRPDFATGAVGITFLFFANFGFFFVVMQYMQLILGYSPLQTAFALVPLARTDHGPRRDAAPLSPEDRAADGGRARTVPHRRGACSACA